MQESTSSIPRDETRSLSSNLLIVDKQSQHSNGSGSPPQVNGHHHVVEKPPLRNSSPLSLPPISRDGSLVGDDVTSHSINDEKSK